MSVIGSSFAVHKDTEIDVEKTELLKNHGSLNFSKLQWKAFTGDILSCRLAI